MSHTNSTTNYNLPQFVGTDQPAWLTDINGAFSGIDTAIKNASDAATTAGTDATTANTSIGTLSSLTTTEKTNLVGAVNEVNTAAGTAQTTANGAALDAGNAQTTANTAKGIADALASFVNINTFQNYTSTSDFSRTQGSGSVTYANLSVATNADKSLCKIYGQIVVSSSSAGSLRVKLTADTGLRPTTAITINCLGVALHDTSTSVPDNKINVIINTDGTIEFDVYNQGQSTINFFLFPCVLWVKDFGDTNNA